MFLEFSHTYPEVSFSFYIGSESLSPLICLLCCFVDCHHRPPPVAASAEPRHVLHGFLHTRSSMQLQIL